MQAQKYQGGLWRCDLCWKANKSNDECKETASQGVSNYEIDELFPLLNFRSSNFDDHHTFINLCNLEKQKQNKVLHNNK